MARYVLVRSLAETWLAVRYEEKEGGEIEEGEVVGEFKDETVARQFCQTWYGLTNQ